MFVLMGVPLARLIKRAIDRCRYDKFVEGQMKDAKKARFHAGALGDHQHTNEKMGQTELRWQAIVRLK